MQMRALHHLLALTVELEKRERTPHSQEGGLPTEKVWTRECARHGHREGFIFRLAEKASVPVAVHILGLLGPMCKRLSSTSPLRAFIQTHGESLLLLSVESRKRDSILPILSSLLSIDSVWERRQRRRLQTNDFVQVEAVRGSGAWRNALIYRKTAETYEVVIQDAADEVEDCRDASSQTDPPPGEPPGLGGEGGRAGLPPPPAAWEGGYPNLSDLVKDVPPAKIRWRSRAWERLRELQQEWQHRVKAIDFNTRLTAQARETIATEKVYKAALALVQEKTFFYLYAS
uniref:Uncharacterized protein n=2 Tax=Hemiselmis andersenii TaxID=464988 RepID=A0A7S1DH39_HEMAN|mmetsp:Transcript_14015/g.34245  ORF Transcript_14015/g.34245 Transcript_14015/m.34245 type:complete len:287 (+) Transcript_14015:71-931(+)